MLRSRGNDVLDRGESDSTRTPRHEARRRNGPAHAGDDTDGASGIAVLGLGNTLLSDDGAGVRVVALLQQAEELPGDVTLLDGGTLSFTLLETITGAAGLLVIDAAHMALPAGEVRCLEDAAMDRFLARPGQGSVHEVSLAELLDMARLQDRLPARRALVAIQPANLDWGTAPTPPVAAALPRAAALARARIDSWLP